MTQDEIYDVVVVGGGPSGATTAWDLAKLGHKVVMLDKAGRIKPCGGAIPPRLIRDFDIPDSQIVAKVNTARIIAPSHREVDMPIDGGFVGMVDREHFDEWLRIRAAHAGAIWIKGTFETVERDQNGTAVVVYTAKNADEDEYGGRLKARCVIGADGARSKVAKQNIPNADRIPCVFAYHEIVETPDTTPGNPNQKYDGARCDVFYQGEHSPDFYSWIFPHGQTMSIGTGSANKGFSLRGAVGGLRNQTGLQDCKLIRREGAPIPLKPLKKWDNGKDILVAGDAAGVVAPASGEGIYYAMLAGRLAGEAADKFIKTGDPKALLHARKSFMKLHGRVFLILGIMQKFWYQNDKRRERFVSMCDDPDVQRLTWESYMNKELVRKSPMAHVKIFFKDLAHLFGVVAPN